MAQALEFSVQRSVRREIGTWEVLVADQDTAVAQMAFDDRLAQRGHPTLRFFRWKTPALSLGYKQSPPEWIMDQRVVSQGIELVERPTGGGMAFHGSDVSCSIVVPSVYGKSLREIMETVCESVTHACQSLGIPVRWTQDVRQAKRLVYCLTEPSPYAVLVDGRKVCGFAVRRYRESLLIQGSLLMRSLPMALWRVIPPPVQQALQTEAVSLEEALGEPLADAELMARIVRTWRQVWEIPCFWTKLREGEHAV